MTHNKRLQMGVAAFLLFLGIGALELISFLFGGDRPSVGNVVAISVGCISSATIVAKELWQARKP